MPVIGPPARTEQPYDIGIYYFSTWNATFAPYRIAATLRTYGRSGPGEFGDGPWFGGVPDHLLVPGKWGYGPVADREPLIGWYNDMQQETLDTHILQAASRGIDYFSFYYYWRENGSTERPGQNIEFWKTSQYRNLMDFKIYFVADGQYGPTHWRNNIVPKLIEFMLDPNYKLSREVLCPDTGDVLVEGGRPIVGFNGDIFGRLGGTQASSRENLQFFRDAAMAAGLKNPLLLNDGYRTLQRDIDRGFDGFMPLNLAGVGLDGSEYNGIPGDFASVYPKAWMDFVRADYSPGSGNQNYDNFMHVPGGLNTFDARPWRGIAMNNNPRYIYADPSPEKFKRHLENVKDYMELFPLSMNMAIFYAWNEWGEGGSIEPSTLFGYGYIDAMQEVFGLNNIDYKAMVAEKGLKDIAPDVRIRVEPRHSMAIEGDDMILEVKIMNYSNEPVSGNLSMSQPAVNTDGKAQTAWTQISSSGTSFNLAPGELSEATFTVKVGAGAYWMRQNFDITASYGSESNSVSTFVVKVPPINGTMSMDESKIYVDPMFDLELTLRNYTTLPKSVQYTLDLPAGWTAENTGVINLNGFNGTGAHTNRRVVQNITVTCPRDVLPGNHNITLTISDGVYTRSEIITITLGELVYDSGLIINGDFEQVDENGGPLGWVIQKGRPDAQFPAAAMTLETNPSQVYGGVGNSLRFTSPANANTADVLVTQEEFIKVKPGKTYELTFFARVPSGVTNIHFEASTTATGPGQRRFQDGGAQVEAHEWAHRNWTRFTARYTPTAGRDYVRIWFYNWNPNPLNAFIDNVSFRPVNLEDKTGLLASYNSYRNLEKGNYSEESWTAFTTALNHAQFVLNDNEAIQSEVDAALAKLDLAFNNLEECEIIEVVEILSTEFLMAANNNRITTVFFNVTVLLTDDSTEERLYSFEVNANNINIDGRITFTDDHDLVGFTLTYDIKGNGSNIKAFNF